MKKIVKIFLGMAIMLMCGLYTHQHVPAKAACYYQQDVDAVYWDQNCTSLKKDSNGNPIKGRVWRYSTNLNTAITRAPEGSTIYLQDTTLVEDYQCFVNKNLKFIGLLNGFTWKNSDLDGFIKSDREWIHFDGLNIGSSNLVSTTSVTRPCIALKAAAASKFGIKNNVRCGVDKVETDSAAQNNVFGASLVVNSGYTLEMSGLKISGMCGSSNNPSTLLMLNGRNAKCNLENVWFENSNWYTFAGKKGLEIQPKNAAGQVTSGIGNPGGAITVYQGECTAKNVSIYNCHSYMTGGGVHVSESGIFRLVEGTSNTPSYFKIYDCSGSSGGAMSAIKGGKIELGGRWVDCSIYNNYVEPEAYNANRQNGSSPGYTAGNMHVGEDTSVRIGYYTSSGTSYEVCDGGKPTGNNYGAKTAEQYADYGIPDVGNIINKGIMETDGCTYIYNGDGAVVSDVFVTGDNAAWYYGKNGTTTSLMNRSKGATSFPMALRRSGKTACYQTALTNNTICCTIKADRGEIRKEHTYSKLEINSDINTTNFSNPRTIVYLRNGSEGVFQGSIKKENSSNTRPLVVGDGFSNSSYGDLENCTVSGFTAGVTSEDILVSKESHLNFTGNSNYIQSDLTVQAGASSWIGSDVDFTSHYMANYGKMTIGSSINFSFNPVKATVSNARIDNYGSTDKCSTLADYETFLNENPSTGILEFHNNETVGCQLRLFGGMVKFIEYGQYNQTAGISYSSGCIYMNSDNIKVNAPLELDGDSANVTIKNCRGTTGYTKTITNKKGLVEVADKGTVSTIVNGSRVEIQDAGCRVSELTNCGFGKVYHKDGHVTKLYNGRYKSVTDKSGTSSTCYYYHSGGAIDAEENSTAVFNNYARYYGAAKVCQDVTSVKILSGIENHGTMRLGDSDSSSVNLQIGANDTNKRKSIINHGTIVNHKGRIYASFISNYDTIHNQEPEETRNTTCIINCDDDITNVEGEFKSYTGTVKARKYINRGYGTTLIRGTSFHATESVRNEKNGMFHILNPLLPEQATRFDNTIQNEGTLTMDNEVTDATTNLKPSLEKITGTGTIKLNASAVENQSAMHRAMEVTIENDNPDKVTSENEGLKENLKYEPSLYWETSGNLELGPGVTIPKGIKNNHSIKVTSGTMMDTAANLSQTLPTKVKAVENNGTLTSGAKSKILLTGENQDGSLYTNVGKTTTLNGAIVSDKNTVQIVNQSGATTKLMRSGLTGSETDSGYKGQVVNNGGTVVLGAKGSEEFRVNNTNEKSSSISNNGGTTTIKNGGVSENSVIDAVYVSDGQVVLDDTEADMLYNKKIQVTLDDSKGTWKAGKPAILDNSTRTRYMLNLNRYANDSLVCNLKVPFSKISNGDRLQNWTQYISASQEKYAIECSGDSEEQKSYILSTYREKDTLPEDDTVYLTLLDNTPPEITFDGSKNKYVEVDCRAGSHSTEYLPLQVRDDITGVKSVKVEVTNTDSGEKRTKTFTFNNELTPSIPEESILSLHNDNEKESFGNLKVKVTAEDAAGNRESVSKEVMAGRISIVIEDKFKDSQTQSGNPYCYWNFIKVGEDEYKENIGAWLAGDQKWLTVKLEGFWDKVSFGYKNTQGVIEMKDVMDNPNQWDVEKSGYKTINGKKGGKHLALTVPLKAKHKDLNFTGTIVTEKEGAHGRDKKIFTYELNTLKKVSIENSIEKRILQQNTQLPDGRWTDGLQIFPKQ